MSGSLWLKHLYKRYEHANQLTPEEIAEIDAWHAKVVAYLEKNPPPPPTQEELERFDAAIDDAERNGWTPGDPRPGRLWIDGVRVWRPSKREG